MSTFDPAFDLVMFHECPRPLLKVGGGFVNDKRDPGGCTVYGISTLMINRLYMKPCELGIADFTPGEMKKVTLEKAKEFYRSYYWNRLKYQLIDDQNVATKIMDCAVNCGEGRAHRMAQKAAIRCGRCLSVDGILGPNTVRCINACEPKEWLQAMVKEMVFYYTSLTITKPSLSVFLKTWLRRAKWGG
jgi:lysozyme family protein